MNDKYNGWCKCCNIPVSSCKNRGEAKRGDTSQIFEPGDFVGGALCAAAAERANAKLASLGIDAETPGKLEKLRYLEAANYLFIEAQAKNQERIAELERKVKRWDAFEKELGFELDSETVENLLQKLATGIRSSLRVEKLERMIADAPCVEGRPELGGTGYSIWSDKNGLVGATHRARLVQIEEIK